MTTATAISNNNYNASAHAGIPAWTASTQHYNAKRSHSAVPWAASARHTSPPTTHPELAVPSAASALLYRSVSAESAPLPGSSGINGIGASHGHSGHGSHSNLVQRLAHQNAAIREAWEAERNYLEANRRRAEEVYQEERVIMDEVREGWESEKATMLRENELLKERLHRLEGENHALKAMSAQGVHISGVVSPQASLRGDSVDNSADGGHHSLVFHAGGDVPPRRPTVGSSRTSPTGQPESSPFIPLDPRMQTQTSTTRDFLSPSIDESDTPVPVIDVQEVDPKLEGIPLKATAVQKATFGAGDSHASSPAVSPPAVSQAPTLIQHYHHSQMLQHHQDQAAEQLARPDGVRRPSSKEHTLQVLQAEASRRLTMHAGHTPNHSLSRFPTMSVAASSTGATQDDETSGQASTSAPYAQTEPEENEDEGAKEESKEETTLKLAPADDGVEERELKIEEGHPDELLDAGEDDVALKGPLMIRNIPAQDEIFWDQVNKKLEPISQGMDSLPTVMRVSVGEEAAGPLPVAVPVGGDASNDASNDGKNADASSAEEGEAKVSGRKGVEGDIALKFRTTTNFGAPFGMA